MAVSLQEAAQKFERNAVRGIQESWQSGVNAAGPMGYCQGMAHLGVNTGACASGVGAHWQQGVQSVNPGAVAQRVAGSAQKWQNNWLRKMNGG
jgi:hypothetical protein